MSELTSLKHVIDNLKDSTGRSFFLRTDGIIHNGINIDSTEVIKCIADGKILAMRLTDDYVNIKSLKEDVAFDEEFIAACHLSAHFFNGNIIKDSTKEENSENENKYYFLKRKKNDKKQTSYEYLLNKELKEYDRIEALYFLNEVISNNFVLIEHDLTKLNGDNIKFYSLYNHLAPLGRMTYEQKLNLPWYEHKITMTESKGIAVYRLKNGNIYKSRTLQETMPSSTEFEFDFNEIKTFNKNSTKMPLKVKYISKDESKEGYIYLNENNKYTEKEWNDSIEKFWKVINEEKDTVNFLNFQINVSLKKWIQKNTIIYPNIYNKNISDKAGIVSKVITNALGNAGIKAGEKIGYAGFNFMEEDKLDEKTVILKDGEPKPFTVHIETFFKDDSELKFDYKSEDKWEPFFFKVNSDYEACTGKPTTEGTPANDSYAMSLIEILGEEAIYSDEVFYRIKVIARIKENSYYVKNGEFTKWDDVLKVYIPNGGSPVILYNSSGIKLKNTTVFDERFYYLYGSKNGDYRRFQYFYELINRIYLIKKDDFDKLKKETEGKKAKNIFKSAKEGKHYFIQSKLDSSNLYTEIKKKEVNTELIAATIENPVTLEYQNNKIYEYDEISSKVAGGIFNTKILSDSWYKTKANDKEYWISRKDVKIEKDGTPVEVISYNDWNKGFEVIELKKKNEFKIKDYKKINVSNIEVKEYEKQIQKNKDSLKNSLKKGMDNEEMIEKLVSNTNGGRNIIFEHHNEWDNNKTLINTYKDSTKMKKDKYEKTLEAYSFMDTVKTKLDKKDTFFYVNPYYFVNRMDKIISIPDFNPYEEIPDKKIRPRHPGKDTALILGSHYNEKLIIKSNPGFTPAVETRDSDIAKIKYPFYSEHYNLYISTVNWCYGCPTYSESNFHSGIDFCGIENSSIISYINGEVWACTYDYSKKNTYEEKKHCYGKMMFIKGNNGYLYLLGHLDSYLKKEGEKVKPGDKVAIMGNTGYSDGAHLHLEVFECKDYQKEDVLNSGDENISYSWNTSFPRSKNRKNPLNY
ncbi:MAG: M23 family metallopeptidase [Treponema sp.]|nr:M23 family metallopeptidase [Treponema sp.]